MVSKVALLIAALLGHVGTVFSGRCPEDGEISPCSCRDNFGYLSVVCQDEDMTLDDVKKVLSAFNTTYPLHITFYYLNLGTVPTDFFKGFNIEEMDFSNCKFDPIPDEEGRVLVGLEDTLQALSMTRSIEKHNSPLVLSHLNKLSTLHLFYNEIPELSDNWFKKGPSSLEYLSITGSGIEKLGSHAFANLPNLRILWLEENDSVRITRSMLPNPATHLRTLHFDEIHLEELPEDIFTDMPALASVTLENNHLTNLPQETFEKIWAQLYYIELKGNKIDCKDSSLKWIADSKHTPEITGKCATPPSREGRTIESVIQTMRKGQE